MSRRQSRLLAIFIVGALVSILIGSVWSTRRQRQLDVALISAIERNDTTAALSALQSHANPNSRARGEAPPSLWGYLLAEWDRIRGLKPVPEQLGQTALTLAVDKNNTAIVEALVAAGARDIGEKLQTNDIDGGSNDGTLLMYAASQKNPAIVRVLGRSGSDANISLENGQTALFYCSDGPTVRALTDCKANINLKDNAGSTALDYCIRHGLSSASHALIERGAKDAEAMSEAVDKQNIALLKTMLACGWNVNTNDSAGTPPLISTLYTPGRWRTKIALLLIQHGANVNFRRSDGCTPLHCVAGNIYSEKDTQAIAVAKALLNRGAQVNAQDEWGETPLMIATLCSRPAMVRLLLQHGANANIRIQKSITVNPSYRIQTGSTALSLAAKDNPFQTSQLGSYSEIIRLLKAAGAQK